MLRLHTLPALDRAPSLSPFCMKVETYLRMTGTPFTTTVEVDATKAPKGKLPFITLDDRRMGDSGLILEHLEATSGAPLDAALSPADRAVALGLTRLMEEHLYWAILVSRWYDDRHWTRLQSIFFAPFPRASWPVLGCVARATMGQTLRAHGLGRHTRQEIFGMGMADLTALADWLAGKPFFLGDQPTSLDATAYSFLSNVIDIDMDTEIRRHALSRANLLEYCQRMRARYYPHLP